MHRAKPLLVLAMLAIGFPTLAQSPDAESRLLGDLKFLTSEACEGRGITTKGIQLAAEHIEREFIKAGCAPGGTKGYSQPFALATGAKLGKRNTLSLKGSLGQIITLERGRDFEVLAQGGSGMSEAPLVFAGYGITSPESNYDDYAGLDVAGKVVVVLALTPRRANPFVQGLAPPAGFANPYSLRARAENALKHKASGILFVNGPTRGAAQSLVRSFLSPSDWAPWGLPAASLHRDLADSILLSATGRSLAQIEKQIDADFKPQIAALPGWSCSLQTEVEFSTVPVRNVIGVLEGKGPLAKETIVIGAHYDHVGLYGTTRRMIGMPGRSGPGGIGGVGMPMALIGDPAIHHGADDNASGTSVLIELARRFGAIKNREGRRIVFIAFSAEESGLLGSEYYARHPTFPIDNTVMMINMDQVGRLQEDKLMVGGLGTAKQFAGILERLNNKHRFQLTIDPSGMGPSDHSSFYAKKVPVLWFFTGFHEQYHRPTDRVETLNVPGLAKVAHLIGDIVEEVSSTVTRPLYAKTGGFDRTKTLWSAAPSTGIVPDYADDKGGVLVANVFKDTAAAKAGVAKGDRIRAIAGTPVADAKTFIVATRALKAGDKVDVVVERAGKEEKLAMQLFGAPPGYTDSALGLMVNVTDVKSGLHVLDVSPAGAGAKAGIKKGDRITAIAGEVIRERDQYFTIQRSFQPGETISITIDRAGKAMPVQVTLPAAKGKK